MAKSMRQLFDIEMSNIYRRAYAEANYNATRFLQMLEKYGRFGTA